jgi:geranylgeranyl diphosphate synthase type II
MHEAHTPRLVRETLQEYGAITRAAMKRYLPGGEPRSYLYDLLPDYPGRGGKMMRSSLCIANARAFGASIDDALCSAVAIEMLHNALLIHDDIEDESDQRRNRPTLHAIHGVPVALNAGDALVLLSLRPLFDNFSRIGPWLAQEIVAETERMAWESAEGQALDLGWRRDKCHSLTDADYLVMVLKKTCWLAAIHPSHIGAMIGTRHRIDLEPFIRFGFFLGSAFQIQDDLLNFIADDRYGKELNGDIFEGKCTIMLSHAYRTATAPEREQLTAFLDGSRAQRTKAEVEWVRALMDTYGSVDYARGIAHGLAGAALHEYACIYGALPDSRDKEFIRGLVTWVFERT